jgi:NADH-quinone oxidoreductase subunit L
MTMASLLWLIPALPLLGFVVNSTVGKRLPAVGVAAIGSAGPILSFLISLAVIAQVHEGQGPAATYWSWMHTGAVDVGFGLSVDSLTAVMLMIVTGIGSLIHVYSYGYMHEDPGVHRFFAYLNLFMCAMLLLVMGDSLPLMFVGWEGVGLCSYLLIGFWFTDFANVDAGVKAFIANRVGDFAFLIGMFTLFGLAGTLQFHAMQEKLPGLGDIVQAGPMVGWPVTTVLALSAVCLFIGATGKSAQIPLYVWLPDAMAGPTPVSALIHAATMVTAGVYMIGRMSFLFAGLDGVMTMIGFVAACTAILSGTIAIAQNDIKKVLAYSTVSQLGFMFCGMASTYFASGLFHVATHAFFKALLFLGAGAVIVAMHHEQDIRKMGGLMKDIPFIAVLFGIGSAALAGIPPFAGFWSKDEIMGNVLGRAMVEGGIWWLTFALLLVTAGLTAFYTTRLFVLTFMGKPADPHRHVHPVHPSMTGVLVVLAILSAFGGALGLVIDPITETVFTQPAWHVAQHETVETAHLIALALSTIGAFGGVAVGWFLYGMQPALVDGFVSSGPGAFLYRIVEHKFYVDEIYDALFVQPTKQAAMLLWGTIDRLVIDRLLVEGAARSVVALGAGLRRFHTGSVNVATASMAVGAVAVLIFMLLRVANG